ATIGCVKTIERHLDRVERIVVRQHSEMNSWALMSCETNKTCLALFLRLIQCFDHATLRKMQVRVILVDDFVNLPEVQMVGSQPLQRFLELLHGDLLVAPVCANFGHQKDS